MDNLPVAMVKWKAKNSDPRPSIKVYDRGFPVGFKMKVRRERSVFCFSKRFLVFSRSSGIPVLLMLPMCSCSFPA
jgi:hypothetical protein